MGLADKALRTLAWVAPGAALARARALVALENARAYDGAKQGRRGESFNARHTSANVEIGAALSILRNRSRDLARNTSDGARVLKVKGALAIGTGIRAVPDNGSDRIDRQARDAWEEWCATSDIEGEQCFEGQQLTAYNAMHEGGDSLIRFVPTRFERGKVPLKLQVLEGDFLDGSRDRATYEGIRSRLGVGLGDWDRRLGYWLHPDHPGELNYRGTAFVSKFVTKADIVHLYVPLRAGQLRGVPIFAPVLLNARDLADLMEAVLLKAKTEACFSVFVKTDGAQTGTLGKAVKEGEGGIVRRIIERLAPGMIGYLNPGEDVVPLQPSGTSQFDPIWLAHKMSFAAGTDITYDQLSGDMKRATYSSLKAADRITRRLTAQEQTLLLIPRMMRPVTDRWTQAALDAGVLRPRRGGYRWDYILPAVEPIDPRKDLEADILAVRSGRMTPQEFFGSWGQDWRKVVEDHATFQKVVDEKGLLFDIDARQTSQVGVRQPQPDFDPEAAAAALAAASAD